jgi:hypothetical protein
MTAFAVQQKNRGNEVRAMNKTAQIKVTDAKDW